MTALDDDAQVRLSEIEARLAGLRSELDDLSAAVLPTTNEMQTHADQAAIEPVYPDVEAWVEGYFCTVFARPIGGEIRWCSKWFEHPEAVTRLEALWRSWETLRLDPNLGMATWLTSFLDPQLAALLSRSGTFAQCAVGRHATAPPMAILLTRRSLSIRPSDHEDERIFKNGPS